MQRSPTASVALDAVPAGHDFTPLMTCYLTDSLDADELERGFQKAYYLLRLSFTPANATSLTPVMARNVSRRYHAGTGAGWKTSECHCWSTVRRPMRECFRYLRSRSAFYRHRNGTATPARSTTLCKWSLNTSRPKMPRSMSVTAPRLLRRLYHFTPQHLMFNRNDMLVGGIRPHLYQFADS